MDKKTIKSLIIKLREIDGKSFGAISNILAVNYGVHMTRQSVCGMYRRATTTEAIKHTRDLQLAVTDIVNYHSIGKSTIAIQSLLQEKKISLSGLEISNIITENEKYLRDIHNDQVKITKNSIESGESYDILVKKLSYDNIEPTKFVVNTLIKYVANTMINDKASAILAQIYTFKEDIHLLKNIIDNFQLTTNFTSISKHLN